MFSQVGTFGEEHSQEFYTYSGFYSRLKVENNRWHSFVGIWYSIILNLISERPSTCIYVIGFLSEGKEPAKTCAVYLPLITTFLLPVFQVMASPKYGQERYYSAFPLPCLFSSFVPKWCSYTLTRRKRKVNMSSRFYLQRY